MACELSVGWADLIHIRPIKTIETTSAINRSKGRHWEEKQSFGYLEHFYTPFSFYKNLVYKNHQGSIWSKYLSKNIFASSKRKLASWDAIYSNLRRGLRREFQNHKIVKLKITEDEMKISDSYKKKRCIIRKFVLQELYKKEPWAWVLADIL